MKQFLDFGESPPGCPPPPPPRRAARRCLWGSGREGRREAAPARPWAALPPPSALRRRVSAAALPSCCLSLLSSVLFGRKRLCFLPEEGSFPGDWNCGKVETQLNSPVFGIAEVLCFFLQNLQGWVEGGGSYDNWYCWSSDSGPSEICQAFCKLAACHLIRSTKHKKGLTSAGTEKLKSCHFSVTCVCPTKTPYPNDVVLEEVWEKEQDANTKSRSGGLGI